MSNRNATASWSGYSHQGQVGLLVALREIRHLISTRQQNEFPDHFIEYESFEDIAIYKITNTVKVFLSVHQVKAYYSNGHLFNAYNDVFTGNPIYQKEANGKNKKDSHGNNMPTGNYESGQWCTAFNYLHSVLRIGNWPTDFTTIGGNPYNIERYSYSTDTYHCGTNEISSFILNELESVDFHNNDHGAAIMALQRLSYRLDEKIRLEHSSKETKNDYEIKFNFQELLAIISDTLDVSTHEIFISRKLFFDKFIDVVKNDELNLVENHIEEVRKEIIQKLYELENGEFLDFLKRLNPSVSPELLNDPQYNFNPDGFYQVFFDILLQVNNRLPIIEEQTVKYKMKADPDTYVLTTIMSDISEKKSVVENIIKNLKSQNLLWERHALVNRFINGNFVDLNPKINEILEGEEKNDEHEKFMSFTQSTKLIDRDQAKQKLNNGAATE